MTDTEIIHELKRELERALLRAVDLGAERDSLLTALENATRDVLRVSWLETYVTYCAWGLELYPIGPAELEFAEDERTLKSVGDWRFPETPGGYPNLRAAIDAAMQSIPDPKR